MQCPVQAFIQDYINKGDGKVLYISFLYYLLSSSLPLPVQLEDLGERSKQLQGSERVLATNILVHFEVKTHF